MTAGSASCSRPDHDVVTHTTLTRLKVVTHTTLTRLKVVTHTTLTRLKVVTLLASFLTVAVILLFHCLQSSLLQQTDWCCRDTMTYTRSLSATDDAEHNDRIRYKHTQRHLPGCLIIGVRKGGTRALLEFMNMHPMIQAHRKETHYFDNVDNYSNGLEWYRKRMPYSFPDQVTVEKTPAYFTSDAVPERVYRMNCSVKLVVVLRDPVQRVISDYMQIHSNKLTRGRPHDTFEELAMDAGGEVRQSYNAVRRSLYARHVARWLRWFPLERFCFVDGDNLIRDPVSELRRVESFLQIEHKLTREDFRFNATKGFYCMVEDGRERCLAHSKGRAHPRVERRVLEKLYTFFRPHNDELFRLIKQTFNWSLAEGG